MKKINPFLGLIPAIVILSQPELANSLGFTAAKSESAQIQEFIISSTKAFNYDNYAVVLNSYVDRNGLVNYKGLQANRQGLDTFNAGLSSLNPSTYESWNEKEKIAFWINAYNALTLQSIIDQNPLKNSIRDIPGVWKRRTFNIAGQAKTLDNIEHNTLRVNFNEPRIHVALVCAAMSCPPLRKEPYTANKLDAQLDNQVRKFIASPHGFRIDKNQGRVYLSSIFKWYGKDWKQSYGVEGKFTGSANERAVLNFLSNYLSAEARNYLIQGAYKISYLDYDWSLNKQ
ncbi:MAG: DUF547 domain-containing protein [Moorea sp. SIO2B7]|nr:DUF547 domain-containing protein [Moorena sp. SIO2B7]